MAPTKATTTGGTRKERPKQNRNEIELSESEVPTSYKERRTISFTFPELNKLQVHGSGSKKLKIKMTWQFSIPEGGIRFHYNRSISSPEIIVQIPQMATYKTRSFNRGKLYDNNGALLMEWPNRNARARVPERAHLLVKRITQATTDSRVRTDTLAPMDEDMDSEENTDAEDDDKIDSDKESDSGVKVELKSEDEMSSSNFKEEPSESVMRGKLSQRIVL
ncbi:hypothetical protein MMC18_006088 [Xylographa bjoerkii]|nr:hypothetical protein [Xylographa bjoerkii]